MMPLWEQYSRKLRDRLDRPRYVGYFLSASAQERGMRLVRGQVGEKQDAIQFCLYWLVDESDGVIADVKFQAIGPTGLIAALEAASELVLRKNYDQASRLSAELIDRHLRDRPDQPAFPDASASFLNQVLEAIDRAVQQCLDIPYAVVHDMTPIEEEGEETSGGIAEWEAFSEEKQLKCIEEVIEKEIRPYIELDAGGVKVLGLRNKREVRISYEGSCTTCHSATGSTLNAIQKILRARIHPSLSVIPEF